MEEGSVEIYEKDDESVEEKKEERQAALAKRLLSEIKLAQRRQRNWLKEARQAWTAYMGERSGNRKDTPHKYNIFWSNIETESAALYSSTPKPMVVRRNKDKDPVARLAALCLERATDYHIQPESFDLRAEQAVRDYLVVGRAINWLRYVPYEGADGIDYEEVAIDSVAYDDFLYGPCTVWEECPWVARRLHMRRKAVASEFGADVAEQVLYSTQDDRDDYEKRDADTAKELFNKAEIWEIWDKESRSVYWVSAGFPRVLKSESDPLKLQAFFPCPRPLLGTTDGDSLIPRADYCFYSDELATMDELSVRIDLLTKALAVKGVRDAQYEELDRLIDESAENDIIPVENFAQFMQDGGLEKLVQFAPIEKIAATLKTLIDLREIAKRNIQEIKGISDIVRGQGDPRETATAQRIKGQFASLRLQNRQRHLQRYLREIVALTAEIIAEHFQPQTLGLIADVPAMTEQDQALFPAAYQLLQSDVLRTFKVDIETDQTAQADQQAEKQAAIEFIGTIGKLIQEATQFAPAAPEFLDVVSEMLLMAARRFNIGRAIEGKIEESVEQFKARVVQQIQATQQQPNPEAMRMQAEAQAKQADAAFKQQQAQTESQVKQAELALKQQESTAEIQLKQQELALEGQRLELEREKLAIERAKFELQAKQVDFQARQSVAQMEMQSTQMAGDLEKYNRDYVLRAAAQNGEVIQLRPRTRKVGRLMDDPENPGQRIAIIDEVPVEEPQLEEQAVNA